MNESAPTMIQAPSVLIRNARILLPDGSFTQGDILTRNGTIAEVAPSIASPVESGDRQIDAQGLTVLPGVIDPQSSLSGARVGIQRRSVHG